MALPELPPMSPWQQTVWESKKRNWLLYAGRRKGKSHVCWRKGVQYGLNGMTTVWMSANITLANENWQDVVAFCRPFATTVNEVNTGHMTFVNPEKGIGRFKRKTSFSPSAGRAGKINFLILDEVQLMTRKTFSRTRPALLTTRGRTAMTCTPPEDPTEFHQAAWLKEIIDASDDEGNCELPAWKNWLVTKSPTTPEDVAFVLRQEDLQYGIIKPWQEYVNLAIDSLDEDRQLMGDEDFNREYLLYWVLNMDQLVYDNFRDGYHCKEDYDYDESQEVFWCADRGEGAGYSVILFFQRKQVGTIANIPIFSYRFFDEICTRRLVSEDELVSTALERTVDKSYRPPRRLYYDARAPRLGLAGQQCGISTYSCNVKVEDGIRVNRRLIGRNLFEIHPRCKLLHQNIMNYMRDNNGFPLDENNDAADAVRYGISMSEKLDGNMNSVIGENRLMAEKVGVESDSVMLLRI